MTGRAYIAVLLTIQAGLAIGGHRASMNPGLTISTYSYGTNAYPIVIGTPKASWILNFGRIIKW
jgi:hypothetical protein